MEISLSYLAVIVLRGKIWKSPDGNKHKIEINNIEATSGLTRGHVCKMAAFIGRLAERYNAAVTARPYVTTSTAGFLIASSGDVACQRLFDDQGARPFDAKRTLDMGLIRAFVMAPLLQSYFPFLNWLVPGRTLPRVLLRVCADQVIGSPLTISLTFAAAGLLKGEPGEIMPRITSQMWPTWQAGASYWPFVHGLNFAFVPVHHQALVAHVMSVYWNMILSYRANKALHAHGTERGGHDGDGGSSCDNGNDAAQGKVAAIVAFAIDTADVAVISTAAGDHSAAASNIVDNAAAASVVDKAISGDANGIASSVTGSGSSIVGSSPLR